jgi:predicted acetyltransferase
VRQVEERGQTVSQMSDFYVRPSQRRRGVGGATLEALWCEIPGHWELQVHVRNEAAMRFWPTLIARHATRAAARHDVVEGDGRRVEYRFHISASA